MVDAGSGTLTVYGDGYSSTFLTVEDLGEASTSLRQRSIIKTSAGITSGDSELATRVGVVENAATGLAFAQTIELIVVCPTQPFGVVETNVTS